MTVTVRVCRLCGTREVGELPPLFKYGIRHYAHAWCLASKYGTKDGRARVRRWDTADQPSIFTRVLKEISCSWTKARIRVKDDEIARAEKRARR